MTDPALLELRDEIGLITARLGQLASRVDAGESAQRWRDLQAAHRELMAATRDDDREAREAALATLGGIIAEGLQEYQTWREIVELTEQRRKLVESERKRTVEMQQMITAAQAMTMLATITDVIRRNVHDPSTLAVISAELRALTVIEHNV